RDMEAPALSHAKVMAVLVQLLESTLIRIGSRQYVRANRSYGLTTLTRRHAKINGAAVQFKFRGKSGIEHDVTVKDRRIARALRRCMDMPGRELFQYRDEDGRRHVVDSIAVNEYLRAATGGAYTAKDYRTWAASVYAFG